MKNIKENPFKNFFRKNPPPTQKESVYFYSLHKAGTSLITHALRQVNNLKHVDYETMVFDNQLVEKPVFHPYGHLYGVFRVSEPYDGAMYNLLTQHITTRDFVKDKNIIFMIRDPRDILISLYYSMRDSHVESTNPEINKRVMTQRTGLKNMSLEEFVLGKAPGVFHRFEILHQLSESCKSRVILKYEDLIHDFNGFMKGFEQHIKIPARRKNELYKASRPRLEEDIAAHKRSGKTGQYREKLTTDTQQKINEICRPILERYNYEY